MATSVSVHFDQRTFADSTGSQALKRDYFIGFFRHVSKTRPDTSRTQTTDS